MGPVALHVTASPVLYSFPWYRESSCSIEPGFGLCFFFFFPVIWWPVCATEEEKKKKKVSLWVAVVNMFLIH